MSCVLELKMADVELQKQGSEGTSSAVSQGDINTSKPLEKKKGKCLECI